MKEDLPASLAPKNDREGTFTPGDSEQFPDYRIAVSPASEVSIGSSSDEISYEQGTGYETFPILKRDFSNESEEIVDNSELLREIVKEGRVLNQYEKELLLNPESLAHLSKEEYIAVWQRLNPCFVSHVTRQGFREPDNTHSYHSKGVGEFNKNFTKILEDGLELKSKFSKSGVEEYMGDFLSNFDPTEDEFINDVQTGNKKRIWQYVKARLEAGVTSRHTNAVDESALHLATEEVVESYGAETGNQVFIIYPSDLIASQFNYAFDGSSRGQSFINAEGVGSVNNDLFVWNKDEPTDTRLSLNAGVVFLPKSTLVDRKTGSKYVGYSRKEVNQGQYEYEVDLAKDTVTAMEYWQQYFLDHPDQAPRHIEFYDGDPNQAVQDFLRTNNIKETGASDQTDPASEFAENQVVDKSEGEKIGAIKNEVLMRAANAVVEYYRTHPELRYEDNVPPEDFAEIRALLEA
jgi:hypothetical protein